MFYLEFKRFKNHCYIEYLHTFFTLNCLRGVFSILGDTQNSY